MEASALHAPASVRRLSAPVALLRLRSDEQLLALFRAGSDDAFRVLHDRHRQRLFAYVRQMLCGASRQDAEDVLQDVFVRALGALRADDRAVNVRAWLYRVAHNRCIDHLRRPAPPVAELFELSRKALHDPVEEAQRREDLKRLVRDVGRLPAPQRSALLMREIDGMSYQDLAVALDTTVPAVKSLLVRARVGLVEATAARDTACELIRRDLIDAHDRGVKASSRARRHMRECGGCREYRAALRGMRRSFAALAPAGGLAPLALAKALGIGGAGGGAAAGSGAMAGGGVVAAAGAGATACKVAAVVCTAALTAGGAVEVQRLTRPDPEPSPTRVPAERASAALAPAAPAAPVQAATGDRAGATPAGAAREPDVARRPRKPRDAPDAGVRTTTDPVTTLVVPAGSEEPAPAEDPPTGGATAPDDPLPVPAADPPTAEPELAAPPAPQDPPAQGGAAETIAPQPGATGGAAPVADPTQPAPGP